MFDFLKQPRKVKELEDLLDRVANNISNNYKDAAQSYLKEYEAKLAELEEAGKLKENQAKYYHDELDSLKIRMKNFTHKDQKPYWT